jgi:hypothetical protein
MPDKQTQPVALREAISRSVELIVRALAIGVPVLYVLGRVFKEGYWEHIGLSMTLMSYTLQDYLYWGFAAIFNGLIWVFRKMPFGPLGSLVLTLFLVSLAAAFVVVLRRAVVPRIRHWVLAGEAKLQAWRKDDQSIGMQFLRPFVWLGSRVFNWMFYFLLIIFVIAASVLAAYKAGQFAAERDRKRLVSSGEVITPDARALVHTEIEEGEASVLLECGPQWCVVIRRGDFVAIRQEHVQRIDHCPHVAMLENGAVVCEAPSRATP